MPVTAGRPSGVGTIDLCVALIGAVCASVALVGLPLYGDGGYYFVHIALTGEPLVPNLRVGAAAGQVPVLLAWWLTDDPLLLRHAFAFGYALLPWLSLLAGWLLVRGRAPGLVLFPLLGLVALQLNFSAVSELVLTLHWCWPFVLAALLWPWRRATRFYGWLLAPLLVVLHPLAFAAAGGLALLAGGIAWGSAPPARQPWRALALGFAVAALVRLAWTLFGSNDYERGRLVGNAAVRYLLPESWVQLLLLGACGLLGLLLALPWVVATGRPGPGAAGRWLARVGLALAWALPVLAAVVGVGFLLGYGIALKVALTYPLGLGLMGLAVLTWAHAQHGTVTGERWALSAVGTPTPRAGLWRQPPALAARAAALASAAFVILALARSGAWWTATHGLANLTATDPRPCITYSAQAPYALQWPWMVVIDNWAAPLNALVFRGDPALGPVALLLSGDGCAQLATTGEVHVNDWISWPFAEIDARFGPLRGPESLVPVRQ